MDNEMNFKYQEPRSIPVIFLLDTSGSMDTNGNIHVLNAAVKEMLSDFAKQEDSNVDIRVAIYSFGPDVKQILPLTPAAEAKELYADMGAAGNTPLGGALRLAKNSLIEDKDKISSRCYRPTVVLVSDGMPNDDWEAALEDFCSSGRSSKCYRMAMGIGVRKGDPAYEVLVKFTGDEENVFSAEEATTIRKFFRFVTLSTIQRSASVSPNVVPPMEIEDDEDDEDYLRF